MTVGISRKRNGRVGDRRAQSLRRKWAGAGMRRAVSFVEDFSASVEMTKCTQQSVRNLLSLPPPRGKVDCRSIAKARRMRGKRRYVFIRFYSPHSSLGSLCSHSCHLPPRGKALAVNCFIMSFRPIASVVPRYTFYHDFLRPLMRCGCDTAARWRAATGKYLIPCFTKRSLYHKTKYVTAGSPRTDGFFATFFST